MRDVLAKQPIANFFHVKCVASPAFVSNVLCCCDVRYVRYTGHDFYVRHVGNTN